MALSIVWGKEIDRKKVKEAQARQYIADAGGKFIRLRGLGTVEFDVSGFQSAFFDIRRGGRNRTPRVVFEPMANTNGSPLKTGSACFTKDDLGVLWAEIPDFEHNIKVLAACALNHTDRNPEHGWEIVDAATRERVLKYGRDHMAEYGWSDKPVEEPKASPYRNIPGLKKPAPEVVEEDESEPGVEINEPVEAEAGESEGLKARRLRFAKMRLAKKREERMASTHKTTSASTGGVTVHGHSDGSDTATG